MKNLKAQAAILSIVFVVLISAVVGYLYLQNRDLKSQLVSGNEVANTPVPTKPAEVNTIQPTASPTDEMADWKTYTNTKYGFSIKYPDTWLNRGILGEQEETTLGLEARFVDSKEDMNAFIAVKVREGENGIDIFQKTLVLSVGQKLKLPYGYRVKTGETTVGNYSAVVYAIEYSPGEVTFQTPKGVELKRGNKVYTLELAVAGRGNVENRKLFDRILSTFKFLD